MSARWGTVGDLKGTVEGWRQGRAACGAWQGQKAHPRRASKRGSRAAPTGAWQQGPTWRSNASLTNSGTQSWGSEMPCGGKRVCTAAAEGRASGIGRTERGRCGHGGQQRWLQAPHAPAKAQSASPGVPKARAQAGPQGIQAPTDGMLTSRETIWPVKPLGLGQSTQSLPYFCPPRE